MGDEAGAAAMTDELDAMRRRLSAEAAIGLATGDHVVIPASEAAAIGLDVPADAPRVDYMVADVVGDTFKLSYEATGSGAGPRPGARRSGHRQAPPVPPWARNRGRR